MANPVYCFSDHGNAFRPVRENYQPGPGEILIYDGLPTEDQLNQYFPERIDINAERTLALKISSLEKSMHNHIYAKYNIELQLFFMGIVLHHVLVLIAGQSSPYSPEHIASIQDVWSWHKSVTGHYISPVKKLQNGETLTAEETDWPSLFDVTDPSICLVDLI